MQHFPETPNQSGLPGHWNGVRDVLTSLLGPSVPNDPTNSYNLQQYDHDLDDNGSTGFGYDSITISPAILFDHLKNGSFLTFSKIFCTSSRNTTLTA